MHTAFLADGSFAFPRPIFYVGEQLGFSSRSLLITGFLSMVVKESGKAIIRMRFLLAVHCLDSVEGNGPQKNNIDP